MQKISSSLPPPPPTSIQGIGNFREDFKEIYEAQLEFPEGSHRAIPFCSVEEGGMGGGGGVWIFWHHTFF